MVVRRMLLSLLLALLVVAPASSQYARSLSGGQANQLCPKGVIWGDGCTGANVASTFIDPNFFSTAPTQGQSYGNYTAAALTANTGGGTLSSGYTGLIAFSGTTNTRVPYGMMAHNNTTGQDLGIVTDAQANIFSPYLLINVTIGGGTLAAIHSADAIGFIGQGCATTSSCRPPQNLAGVDFPVGYYTPIAQLKDPAVVQPTGCHYYATGNSAHTPGITNATLACDTAGVNYDIEGYDFGAHGCTWLFIYGPNMPTAGSLTLKNNRFVNGSNCDSVRYGGANSLFTLYNADADISYDYEFNEISDEAPTLTGSGTAISTFAIGGLSFSHQLASPGCSMKIKYNYIHNIQASAFGGADGFCTVEIADNYVNGLGLGGAGIHAALFEPIPGNGTQAVPALTYALYYRDNVINVPTGAGALTAVITFHGSQTGLAAWGAGEVVRNTIIVNGGSGNVIQALQGYYIDSLLVQGNYIDPTGTTNGCATAAAGGMNSKTFLIDDGTGTSTPGNILTLPGGGGGFMIPGAHWANYPGKTIMYGVIQPFQTPDPNTLVPTTGTGLSTGTYVLDGPPQYVSMTSVSLSTGAVVEVPIHSLTWDNSNVNMLDGSKVIPDFTQYSLSAAGSVNHGSCNKS